MANSDQVQQVIDYYEEEMNKATSELEDKLKFIESFLNDPKTVLSPEELSKFKSKVGEIRKNISDIKEKTKSEMGIELKKIAGE